MVKPHSTSRRKRGVLLSPLGCQRLQAAEHKFEVQENQGIACTLEILSEKTGLSPNTITKVRRQQAPVDRQTLETYFNAFDLILTPEDCQSPDATTPGTAALRGQMPLEAGFYIERPPLEALCQEAVLQPGAFLHIRAPQQMGKTALLSRTLAQARSRGLTTVLLSLKLADASMVQDIHGFLRWFCAVITRQLDLPNQVSTLWDPLLGSSFNCTDYFERQLLPKLSSPLVLALDDIDALCEAPATVAAFFKMLQTWHEIANYGDSRSQLWQRLRLVLVYADRAYLCDHFPQLPLEVGMTLDLPNFTHEQVETLVQRYGFEDPEPLADQLMQLLNGQPNLTQLMLQTLNAQMLQNLSMADLADLNDLIDSSLSPGGIFADHLLRQLYYLQQYPELLEGFKQVVQARQPIVLPPLAMIKLKSLGLIRCEHQKAAPQCQLYQNYFRYVLG